MASSHSISELLDFQRIITPISPLLSGWLQNAAYLPFSWRKATLKHCRIQRSSTVNQHLLKEYQACPEYEIPLPSGAMLTIDELRATNDLLLDYAPITASLISMMVRARSTYQTLRILPKSSALHYRRSFLRLSRKTCNNPFNTTSCSNPQKSLRLCCPIQNVHVFYHDP